MKKSILFMSAVAILAAASCNKELPAPSTEHSPKTFTATVDDADTKTVLNEGKSYWNGTEAIRVLDGAVSKVFETTVENQLTATFAEKDAAVVLTGDYYLAIYPGSQSEHATWSGDVNESAKNLWLKDYQEGIDGSYDPEVHAAIAYTEAGNDNLEFKNIVSLVKVTVGNDNVGDIMFYGKNEEQLAGNFNVKYNDGNPVVDFDGVDAQNAKSKIYLRGEKEKGSTYYFAVLPQVLEDGFTVEFNIETVPYTKSASAPYTIGRNQIIDLGTIEFDVNPITYKTVYMRPGSIWEKTDPACYAAWSFVNGGDGGWFKGADSDSDGVYEFTVPEDNDMIVFAALKTETLAWENNVYYQTHDLEVPASENAACIIKNTESGGKQDSEWATLDEAKGYSEPTVKMYLKPSADWTTSSVSYGVFAWIEGTSFADWYEMTETEDEGIYEVEVPEYYPEVIFVGQNAEFTPDWVNIAAQTEDLALPADDNNSCFILSSEPVDGKTASLWMTLEELKTYEEPAPEPITLTVTKNNDWEKVYIHVWGGTTSTDWPGIDITSTMQFEFPQEDFGTKINYILNNGNNGSQTVDLSETLTEDFEFTLPSESSRFIVRNYNESVAYIHYFNAAISETTWPGIELSKDTIYGYWYFNMPLGLYSSSDSNFNFIIHNNAGTQTKNLWTYDGDGVVKKTDYIIYTHDAEHIQ